MSEGASNKYGRALKKALGIEDQEKSYYVAGGNGLHAYVDPDPTTGEWVRAHTPTGKQVARYFYNIFPFLHWIGYYNVQWFIGDLIAGITVGAVVVPQGMAYAELANLEPEYGLYSSFMGVLIYWFFATSKDITIGPVAVMSTLVGTIIINTRQEHPELDPPVIASALAIICGAIVAALGFLRLGFIVDFIPLPAITAFMTGSAINICAGQVKSLLGETANFSTRGATYEMIINSLKNLPTTQMDAAMGLTALFVLYAIRWACNYGARKHPQKAKLFFFLSTLRTAFVILFYTMISAAVNLHRRDNPAFKILETVPRGFRHAKVPELNKEIISSFAHELPAAVIVLLIEHIAISKSFGRVNNYTIDPSQEFIAIGISNLLGPFLGGYPATGSFSRTAIKAKAGVRTPLAGVITALVVLLAIYALPAVFFYIPKSSLAAVIIHAVGDLVTPPSVTYQFWRVSPIDALIFLMGVIVITFTTIEIGIYCTICVSLAVLLFRLAKARGQFLGQVTVHSVIGDHLLDEATGPYTSKNARNAYLPTSRTDGSNPNVKIQQPAPGIFIYRLSDGLNYPNANHYTDYLVDHIFATTRRADFGLDSNPGDRPWNDPGPSKKDKKDQEELLARPTLQAIILDCASVNNVDVTCVQTLIDVRNQLDRYAAPHRVQWHFAHLSNRWAKRALAAAGFGYPTSDLVDPSRKWKPIFSVAEMHGDPSAVRDQLSSIDGKDVEAGLQKEPFADSIEQTQNLKDFESKSVDDSISTELTAAERIQRRKGAAKVIIEGVDRPFFHVDLTTALESAMSYTDSKAPSLN
ncbi:sulfate transporter [Penicillium argentinense]|uniref:Sulfate transporter n=1 Tax=Penicillium argentinense TaxID=1131581 RepID=A0A9W9FF11_9EURO|nr:sulfate transporter [Penicillium argentinense]KAJ5099023.1 sulfate transporter [Penicillium argentinense]